jgi:DNA-binding transcriptional MerR regulator
MHAESSEKRKSRLETELREAKSGLRMLHKSNIPVSTPTKGFRVYLGQIAEMRRQGYSLQQIGNKVGFTRERIWQILASYYPSVAPESVSEGEAARIIDCPLSRLDSLRKKGIVKPKRRGDIWRYSKFDLKEATLALQRRCRHCNTVIPMRHRGVYCAECQKKSKHNNYPFLSEQAKRNARERNRQWKERHRERVAGVKEKVREDISGRAS